MILENTPLRWVNHITPDDYDNLTMDVMLNGEQQLALSELGLPLRNDEDGCYYRFSYPPVKRDGTPVTISVTDRYGAAFGGKVRNGTMADVEFYTYPWTVGSKSGMKARVVTAKLLEDVTDDGSITYDVREPEEQESA